ncbi:MAG: SUMF1/EgtB/PvdO family nonheme iron enzyme [Okeania sp. SIO3I5]|uniref:bifunctional serine/threonine-protein kinase/formylglycine-generating enzyme family protein n=1 Tax=Okeania sp. SIO3I5 TaxID=2607805 RepID=UPI0013BAB394|nr:bifunctional serine/threonine-protein kinase/formylglycine-generating enzyme family protein [Okeania sp. SIO3I5]NEQ40605.1 SUMF1/EgtB/PvdO family nonheme iron enzyme [Okeania sp. SIO3I5]
MQPGTVLRQRYQIIKLLGSGAFGDTYLAQDLDVPRKRKCVVKHLKPKIPDPAVLPIAQRLFEREAEALDELGEESDQIPKLFAHFQEGTEFYLVQEYIEGEDISKELTPGKKLSESDTIALLKGILEVLVVAHQSNIIHRDIKPENLMRRKSDGKVVLIDFGAVKEINVLTINQQGATTLTVAVGTPGYMPSEQSNGKPKLSSDIYAVGMVGIKALTGKEPRNLPTDSKTGNVIWRNEAEVSNRLADILDRMVQEYFRDRYENATQALQALPKTSKFDKTRRQILILGGLAGGGFVAAMVTKYLWDKFKLLQPKFPIQTFTTVTVNRRGEIISRSEGKAEVMTENLGDGVSLEMVKIPGGRFFMGSPETEVGRRDTESPQHYVDVPEFFMGKYPVTQAQWEAVMGNNPSEFKGANRPVENVSWNDATEFCQKLSEITGKKYSLPSESQWEYACRAGTTTPFYFGETITSELVNYNGTFTYADEPKGIHRKETTDVGIFPPNSFGLYDMHGNVWEWCQDVWHSNYNGAPTDGSAWETGGDSDRRLLRGGCWYASSLYCRCAWRNDVNPGFHNYVVGFRIVSVVSVVSVFRS